MESAELIMEAERTLARESALAVLVKRPPAWWRSAIPGMFLFDFLERMGDTRKHTARSLAVRQPALDAARALAEGKPREQAIEELSRGVAVNLASLWPVSGRLQDECIRLAGLLADHYARLLPIEGLGYLELVGKAYGGQDAYEGFLSLLDEAERRVDRVLLEEIPMRKSAREKLTAQGEERAARRRRESEVVFH